ncbi:MAG: 16S rRNA (adenine(1518)-N(6)/adenine(1519)-N(6)) -dimethyltransferase RsmA [Spirochaetales bacterium]
MGFFDSPHTLRKYLEERGLALKKRFGQNFLIDPKIRKRILETLDLRPGEQVWEIGPGLGSMTDLILGAGAALRCFEIDHGFVRVLMERYGEYERFSIVPGDVVKTWKDFQGEAPAKVFGNLPYSSGAALIGDFLEHRFFPGYWVFMIQKEVAQRMIASPGTTEYSSFSVLCQAFTRIQVLFDVPPIAFYPRPRVVSSLLRMVPNDSLQYAVDARVFATVVRAAFASRRKTLQNTLGAFLHTQGYSFRSVFERAGIDPARRGETLSPEEFLRITRILKELEETDTGGGSP